MQHDNWRCPKCDNDEFDTDRMAATGGGLSKIFDVQNKKFSTVSCTRCGFTELYRAGVGKMENILDLFTS